MEYYESFNVVSGYSDPIQLNYPGQFIFEVMAEHWGGGSVSIERSSLNKNRFGVLKDSNTGNNVYFTSNDAIYAPGLGDYRVFCSGYENMSGVEVLIYPYQSR
jgi:hypothetical protein